MGKISLPANPKRFVADSARMDIPALSSTNIQQTHPRASTFFSMNLCRSLCRKHCLKPLSIGRSRGSTREISFWGNLTPIIWASDDTDLLLRRRLLALQHLLHFRVVRMTEGQ